MNNRHLKLYSKKAYRILLGVVAGSLLFGSAQAQTVIFQENFDSYAPGTNVGTIPDWAISDSPASGLIREAPDVPEGMNFGNSLVTHAGGGTPTSVTARRYFDASTDHLSLSLDMYLFSHSSQITLLSGTTSVAQVFFRHADNAFRIYHQDAVDGNYTDIANSGAIRGWYRVELELYLDSETPSNGSYDVNIYNLTRDAPVLTLIGLKLDNDAESIDQLRLVSTFSANSSNDWDNITLTSAIPEPGTVSAFIGFFALIGVGLYRYRRSRS